MPTAAVIDLSHHNTLTSLKAAKAAGIVGVIHKATQGVSNQDAKMTARYALAKEAGMLWGVYHFLTGADVDRQIENFSTYIQGFIGDDTLIAVDHEADASLKQLGAMLATLKSIYKRNIVIYSGHLLKEQLKSPDKIINASRLWLAQYGPKPVLPIGFTDYYLWQYTDKGTIPDIVGNCDCNEFGNSMPSWSGKEMIPSVPEPRPDAELVVRVTAPKGVKIVIETE